MNFLFHKEGFSFWIDGMEGNAGKVTHIKVSHPSRWEVEVIKELEINLRLRRDFSQVNVAHISSFFNLVPNEYASLNSDDLLNFSEAEFEDNHLLKSKSQSGYSFIYGTSYALYKKLKELYRKVNFMHSGQVFLDAIEKTTEVSMHLNLNNHNLEILVFSNSTLQFYNLFDTPTGEDILFYTLFTLEQLELDSNKIELKTYGELLPETKVFHVLRKYIRKVSAASKDENHLRDFTIKNLNKCALSQVHLEEKG